MSKDLRADDARIAYPLFQVEYGGATPTSALQLRFSKTNRETFNTLNRIWHSVLPEARNSFEGVHFAAECGNKMYAVAWWSKPAARRLNGRGMFELRRYAIADDAPKYTASRFLAWMAKEIKRTMPNVETLISYQDTSKHKGTIYKATGWKVGHVTSYESGKNVGATWETRDGRVEVATGEKVRWEYQLQPKAHGCEECVSELPKGAASCTEGRKDNQ